jgi:hypothetical protein
MTMITLPAPISANATRITATVLDTEAIVRSFVLAKKYVNSSIKDAIAKTAV